MENFSVDSRTLDDVAVIYPKGYLNNIVGERLEKEFTDYLGRGIKKIVLDFAETEFINSIGISILLSILEKLIENEGTLCFTSMSTLHGEIFDTLGLSKYILVFGSEDEALRHFKDEAKK